MQNGLWNHMQKNVDNRTVGDCQRAVMIKGEL